MKTQKKRADNFSQDVAIIFLSVIIAFVLVQTNALGHILEYTQKFGILANFIAGMFFTSIFTTAPAIVALGQLSLNHNLFLVAFFGALGAMSGDFLIFRFVKDKFSHHLAVVLQHQTRWRRIKHMFSSRLFRWCSFVVGGLILASPLPDELGISILGVSKMKNRQFMLLSFVFNFIGIVLIGLSARALV